MEKKMKFTLATLFALSFVGIATEQADAQGLHLGGGGVHIDVGHPHGGHGYYSQSYYPQMRYWGSGWSGGGHNYGHGTTHYDYHPATVSPHYGHYDVAPAHYDVHSRGHRRGHF